MEQTNDPKIIAFLCNWCTYAGADLAGTARMVYPANVRTVRLMCTGSLDPMYVIKAFLEGADGVLVGGCHPGDCHYTNGNFKARRRVSLLWEILDALGIEKDRLWLRWISASEGGLFAQSVTEMVETLRAKGPSPLTAQMIL
ncbi:MAG: hydrogenase iron-sulfur subunit [Thermodesulfobacteriota bacterium]